MPTPNNSVTVYNQSAADVAVIKNIYGWNRGLMAVPEDTEAMINPAGNRLWNINADKVQRVQDLRDDSNPDMILLMSVMVQWNQQHNPDIVPGKKNPDTGEYDWTAWERCACHTVQNALNVSGATTDNVYFEIWNEPNGYGFWPFNVRKCWPYKELHPEYSYKNHFMDTWKHAYNSMKDACPAAKIVGPTFGNFDWDGSNDPKPTNAHYADCNGNKHVKILDTNGIKGFLSDAKSNDVFPDIICWHYPFQDIVHQINDRLVPYMQQSNMSADGIMISESAPENLGFKLASYQRASADNADFLQILCDFLYSESGALGGLRTKPNDTGDPNGNWWIVKKYAQMNEDATMLNTDPYYDKSPDGTNFGGIEVYATQDNNNTHKIILGMYNTPYHDHTGLTRINLENFIPDSYQANYSLYEINGILHDEVDEPQPVNGQLQPDANGNAYLDIDWQNPDDCYYVEVDIGPPLLAVYISGPYEISSGDYHAWEANPVGGEPFYEYNWQSRLYNEHIGWTNWQDRGLGKYMLSRYTDHNYNQLEWKVTITDADNNTAEGFFTVTIV